MSISYSRSQHESLVWPHLYFSRLGTARKGIILFLHGITGSRRYWEKRVQPFASDYQLILPDLLGFGLSPKPWLEYDIEVFRDSMWDFLQFNGWADQPLHIIGHSLGGIIGLEMAAKYPDLVDRLVILNLPRHEDSHSAHDYFWKGSPSYRKLLNQHSLLENLAQLRRTGFELTWKYLMNLPWGVIADARKFTLKSLTSTLENCLLHYRVDPVLEQVTHRSILLIHGRLDQVAPFHQVRDLPARFPNLRLESIPTSGHHIFLTHTDECIGWIRPYLESEKR